MKKSLSHKKLKFHFNKLAKIPVFLIAGLVIATSCNKEKVAPSLQTSGSTSEEAKIRLVNAIKQLTEVTKILFQDAEVRAEIYYLSLNDLYYDAYVGLADLMEPGFSKLYQKSQVPEQYKGAFKKKLKEFLDDTHEDYSILESYFDGKDKGITLREGGENDAFYNSAGLYFYCPYCSNYSMDNFNPVLVPSLADADKADGYRPIPGTSNYEVIHDTDDDYAEYNPTLIITPESYHNIIGGVGSDPAMGPGDPACCINAGRSCCENIRQVHTGWGKLKHQFDSWVSLTGNGGGSEIRILRIAGELTVAANGNITANTAGSFKGRNYSRQEIKNKWWRWWGFLWNADWDCDEVNNKYVVFEEDNEGEVTLTGSVKRTFNVTTNIGSINLGTGGNGVIPVSGSIFNGNELNIGFTAKWTSKDALILVEEREEDEFFVVNTIDQGCGFRVGHTQSVYAGISHPIYECGSGHWEYTLPNRCIER